MTINSGEQDKVIKANHEPKEELSEISSLEDAYDKVENFYEIFYLTSELNEDGRLNIENKVGEIIGKYGGRINNFSKMNSVKFSYPIKNNYSGNNQCIRFYLEPSKIDNIKKDLKFAPEIIRFFILKIIEKPAKTKKKLTFKSAFGAIKRRIIKTESSDQKEEKQEAVIEQKFEKAKKAISKEDIDKKLDEILDQELEE